MLECHACSRQIPHVFLHPDNILERILNYARSYTSMITVHTLMDMYECDSCVQRQ